MSKTINLFLLLITISFFACIKQPEQTTSTNQQSVTGNNNLIIKWPESIISNFNNGINIKISPTVVSLLGANTHILEQMATQWNNADSNHTFFKTPFATTSNLTASAVPSYYDSTMGIYTNNTWFANISSQALAITQFYGIKKNVGMPNEYVELSHADIIINTRDFTFSSLNNNSRNIGQYDIASVILHEMGHFIGLGHQHNLLISSVMHPYLSYTDDKRSLFAFDTNLISKIYNNNSYAMMAAIKPLNNVPLNQPDMENMPVSNIGSSNSNRVSGIMEMRANGMCFTHIKPIL